MRIVSCTSAVCRRSVECNENARRHGKTYTSPSPCDLFPSSPHQVNPFRRTYSALWLPAFCVPLKTIPSVLFRRPSHHRLRPYPPRPLQRILRHAACRTPHSARPPSAPPSLSPLLSQPAIIEHTILSATVNRVPCMPLVGRLFGFHRLCRHLHEPIRRRCVSAAMGRPFVKSVVFQRRFVRFRPETWKPFRMTGCRPSGRRSATEIFSAVRFIQGQVH